MLEQAKENLGQAPPCASADAGYYSEDAVTDPALAEIALYVAPGRECGRSTTEPEQSPADVSVADGMREKLQSASGRSIYKMRKAVVEPVFGQIKEVRGFRRFLMRGTEKVTCEWDLICLTHNLGKLHRAQRVVRAA